MHFELITKHGMLVIIPFANVRNVIVDVTGAKVYLTTYDQVNIEVPADANRFVREYRKWLQLKHADLDVLRAQLRPKDPMRFPFFPLPVLLPAAENEAAD